MSDMSEPAGILMPADGEMIPREQPQASLPFEPVEDDSHWRFWTDPDNREDIIVPHVDAVAVYLSRSGDVEIRPEACDHAHEDNIVFLTPEHARRVAAALVDLADEIERRT